MQTQEAVRIHVPQQSIRRFCREYGLRELALFGSVLRDDFTDQSDVDVLIELPAHHEYSLFDLSRMQDKLTHILHRKVDLVTKDGLSRHLRQEILSTRKVLYVAQE